MKKLTESEIINIVSNIRNITKKYILDNKLRSLVIGVSGGVDSAFDCALLKSVCDELGIPLIGRSITIESNKIDEIERARNIGKHFCTDFKEVDLSDQFNILKEFDEMEGGIDYSIPYKIRMGNIKARMRMIYLYNLASRTGGLVLSTDNLTELNLGFWTLHGDVGDYAPIQKLWKTEVYAISEYLASKMPKDESDALISCVLCNATDGLGISSTDLDQILPDWRDRHTTTKDGYEEIDDIFIEFFEKIDILKSGNSNHDLFSKTVDDVMRLKESPVIKRYYSSEFKRNNPIVLSREEIFKNNK